MNFNNLLLLIGLFLLSLSVSSQDLGLEFTPGKPVLEEKSTDFPYYIVVKLKGAKPGKSVTIRTVDTKIHTASPDIDYSYLDKALDTRVLKSPDSDYFTIGIIVKTDNLKEGDEEIMLNFSYDDGVGIKTNDLKITIKDKDSVPPATPDTSFWKVSLITGSNFDFFEAPVFKNFAGDLNIFLPDLIKLKKEWKSYLGLNFGVNNFRYFEADSSRSRVTSYKYLVDPTVTQLIPDSTKYVLMSYSQDSKITYNNWSLYLNPMITIRQTKTYELYANLHIEVLWRTLISTNTQVDVRKDTIKIRQSDLNQGIVFNSSNPRRPLYDKKTYFDNFFGIGFPLKVNIKKSFEFSLTPTLGITSYSSTILEKEEKNGIKYLTPVDIKDCVPFFLARWQLITTLAPLDIAWGGEYRKVNGQKNAFMGMFLGAVIPIDKLKK